MGELFYFKYRRQSMTTIPPAANDNERLHSVEEEHGPVIKDVTDLLARYGLTMSSSQSRTDINTVVCMVRGMIDRSRGKINSENCIYLECLNQALGYEEDVKDDGEFDDLLGKLQ